MTSSIVRGMRVAFVEVPGGGYELARRFLGIGSTRISPLFLKLTIDLLDLDRSSVLLEGAAFGRIGFGVEARRRTTRAVFGQIPAIFLLVMRKREFGSLAISSSRSVPSPWFEYCAFMPTIDGSKMRNPELVLRFRLMLFSPSNGRSKERKDKPTSSPAPRGAGG